MPAKPKDPDRPCTKCGKLPGEVTFTYKKKDGHRRSICRRCLALWERKHYLITMPVGPRVGIGGAKRKYEE